MSGEGTLAAAPPLNALDVGQRVVVEHPRYGRHYGRVTEPYSDERLIGPAVKVQVESGYINTWPVLEAWCAVVTEGQRDMVIGDLLNLAMLKEAIETEFLGTLWIKGDSGMLTPFVCEASFGDGMHLMTISTINQRPNYHVVRVCSSWRESTGAHRWDFLRYDTIGEHIDEVITAIEDEVGSGRPYEPDDELYDPVADAEGYGARDPWPAIDDRDGCSWGEIDWAWLMRTIGYTAKIERLVPPAGKL